MKIGAVLAYTGPLAVYGAWADPAFAAAEQQVKDMGGILGGRLIKIVKYDDRSTTAGVTAGVTKLVQDDNVSAFEFAGESNAADIVGSIAVDQFHVLYATTGLFDVTAYKYVIRAGFSNESSDGPVTRYIVNTLKPKTVAFLTPQSKIDQTERIPAMQAAFTAAGIKTVEVIVTPPDATDFSPYITRVKYLNPNVLVMNYSAQAVTIAKQLPGLGGWPNTTVISMTTGAVSVNTTTYPVAIGWYSVVGYITGMTNPGATAMLAAWTKANGTLAVNASAPYHYVPIWLCINAAVLAGSTDREAINTAAHSGKLSVVSPFSDKVETIRPDGTNDLLAPVVKFLPDGKFEIVLQ